VQDQVVELEEENKRAAETSRETFRDENEKLKKEMFAMHK